VIDLHRRVATQAGDDGMIALVTQAVPWLALGDIWSGHWPSAAARITEGLELAGATSQLQIAAHLRAIDGLLAALRGDEERCRALAAESLERAAARQLVHVACCATWGLTVLELSLGRAEAALAHVRALPRTAGVDWEALDRIEAAVRAGEPESGAAWLAAFEPWAVSSRAPWGQAVALHCRALLAADQREAERLFRAALDMHERAARPFERARTELALGECLRRARRRAEARSYLRAARAVARRRAPTCAPRWRASRRWGPSCGPSARAPSCAPAASRPASATRARSTSSPPRRSTSRSSSPRGTPTATSPASCS
jgi:tetratricopeptide (TPR) repeat protein